MLFVVVLALWESIIEPMYHHFYIKKAIKNPSSLEPIYADATSSETGTDTKGRTQRQTMALKNVRYRIEAHVVLHQENPELRQKIERSFERRAKNGQCFYQPYLGCKEFNAYFELLDNQSDLTLATNITENLGWMLYDVFNLSKVGTSNDPPSISLFEAKIKNGILEIPAYSSNAVKKPKGGAWCLVH